MEDGSSQTPPAGGERGAEAGAWLGVLLACGVLGLRWALAGRLSGHPSLGGEAPFLAAGLGLVVGARFLPPARMVLKGAGLGLLFASCLSAASHLSGAAPDSRMAVPVFAALALLLYGGLGGLPAVVCGLLCVLSPALNLAGGDGAGFDAGASLGLLLLAGAGALAARKQHRAAAGLAMVLFYAAYWGGVAAGWAALLPGRGGGWESATLTAGFFLFSLSFSILSGPGGAAAKLPGLVNLCAYLLSCLAMWKVTGGLSPGWAAGGALALLAVALPFRSGAGAVRDGVVVGGLLALAFLPRVGGAAVLAAACLGLAAAAIWKANSLSLRRTEFLLLLLVLVAGMIPGGNTMFRDFLHLDLSGEWAALLAVTVLLLLAAWVHDRNRRDFGASLLGVLCAGVTAFLWIHMMVARHGAGEALPQALAAAAALFLGAGWLLGSVSVSAAAMLPVLAAHLCFHAFDRSAVPPTAGVAGMVMVTFLAAAAWEDYLRRHRAAASWDLLLLCALPWWGGLALAAPAVAPHLGAPGTLAAVCALSALLPVLFRRGGPGMRAAAGAAALVTGLLFVAVYGAAGLEAGPQRVDPWPGLVVALSLHAVAGTLWMPTGRLMKGLAAAVLLLGTAALATAFFPLPLAAGELGAAWCMAFGFLLLGRAAGSIPSKVGGVLVLALAATLTLCQFLPVLRGGEPAVFAVVAGGVLLHPGLRRTTFAGGPGGPVHAAPG